MKIEEMPKKQWKSINSLLGKTGNSNSNTINLKPSCLNIANAFNEHFITATSDTNEGMDYTNYVSASSNFSMYLAPTNEAEVKNCLNTFNSTTPGYDDITPVLLKHTSSLISIPLAHIINLTLKTGIFPDQLKKAKVIPIFKSGDRSDINNYRPISILPAVSKIFEKIISVRLIDYLEKNSLLTKHQHGFRARHSTESAILQFVNNVYAGL